MVFQIFLNIFLAVENIQALKTLIAEQKILYDYKYYKHPLETDVITIVLSKEPWKIVEVGFNCWLTIF